MDFLLFWVGRALERKEEPRCVRLWRASFFSRERLTLVFLDGKATVPWCVLSSLDYRLFEISLFQAECVSLDPFCLAKEHATLWSYYACVIQQLMLRLPLSPKVFSFSLWSVRCFDVKDAKWEREERGREWWKSNSRCCARGQVPEALCWDLHHEVGRRNRKGD